MFISPLLCLYVLSLASVVFSSPLPLVVDKWVDDKEGDKELSATELAAHQANKDKIDTAMTDANFQIEKMKTVLAAPDEPKHKEAIEAAFGKNADMAVVKDTVNKLGSGKIKVQPEEQTYADDSTIAITEWKETGGAWQPSSVGFANKFYSGSAAARTGTLIHEGAHYVNKAGDDVLSNRKQKPGDFKIRQGVDKVPGTHKFDKDEDTGVLVTGNTQSNALPKTAADVEMDTKYTAVRDKVSNMHHNAESYAVFGSLCDNMRRRDLHLMTRALESDDKREFHRLWERQSCELPPDYFKNKAAAAKTGQAAGKTSAQMKSVKTPGGKAGTPKAGTGVAKTGAAKKGAAGRPTKGFLASKQAAKGSKLAKSGTTTRPAKGSWASKQPKAAKGSKLAKSGKTTRPAKGSLASKQPKAAKGSKLAKSGKATRPAKGSPASKQPKAAKGSKLAKSGKATRPAKGSPASKQPKAAKGSKLAKSGKATRPAKGSPASKQPKAAKGSKLAKSGKATRPAKGSPASKQPKAAKGSNLAKSGKATRPAKGSPASKQPKAAKASGSKSPRPAKGSKQPQSKAAKGPKSTKSGSQNPRPVKGSSASKQPQSKAAKGPKSTKSGSQNPRPAKGSSTSKQPQSVVAQKPKAAAAKSGSQIPAKQQSKAITPPAKAAPPIQPKASAKKGKR